MNKSSIYGLAVISCLLAPVAGQAALIVDRNDTDGIIGLADIDTFPGAVETFDVIYSGIDTTGGVAGSWTFGLVIGDPMEIDDFDPTTLSSSFFSTVEGFRPTDFLFSDAESFIAGYTLGSALADGTVVASFSLTMLNPGFRPHDDLADFTLFGVEVDAFQAVNIEDPITGETNITASYDVQTIPVPAAGLLLPFGIACLGALRRRKSRAAA